VWKHQIALCEELALEKYVDLSLERIRNEWMNEWMNECSLSKSAPYSLTILQTALSTDQTEPKVNILKFLIMSVAFNKTFLSSSDQQRYLKPSGEVIYNVFDFRH
jgi:hypothetical protein